MQDEMTADIFASLASKKRIEALRLFDYKGIGPVRTLPEIAKAIEMSRTGFQKIVNNFRTDGIIEQFGHRSRYKLTVKGKFVLKAVEDISRGLSLIESQRSVKEVKEGLVKIGSGLSKEDMLRLLDEFKETYK